MKKMQMLSVFIVLLSFITGAYFYAQMPDKMASHWGMSGEVDGYMDKPVALFFMPVLSLFMLGLFSVLPSLDPMKKNYKAFEKEYDGMVLVMVAFLYYLYLLTIAYNMGMNIDLMKYLAPAFGAMFIYLGVVLKKAKQNWFVGIKTPWTLSSEKVWDKTHSICAKLFMAAGVVAMLGAIFDGLFIASVALLVAIAVFSFAYSYIEFEREKKAKK